MRENSTAAFEGADLQSAGRRHDPFRYWLPDKEKIWQQDPFYLLEQQMEQDRHLLGQALKRPA